MKIEIKDELVHELVGALGALKDETLNDESGPDAARRFLDAKKRFQNAAISVGLWFSLWMERAEGAKAGSEKEVE